MFDRSRGHLYNKSNNLHLDFMKRAKFDVVQMLTPPKSKSPWEAMTAGSTGGWAAGLEPWGAPLLMAGSALSGPFAPLVGALGGAAGMAGKGTGFQGTDKGFGGNILPMLGGVAGGYGLGALGSGIGSGYRLVLVECPWVHPRPILQDRLQLMLEHGDRVCLVTLVLVLVRVLATS